MILSRVGPNVVGMKTSPSQSLSSEDRRQQMVTLQADLREQGQALQAEAAALAGLLRRDGAGLLMLPVRLTLGLALAVGALWGLWRAVVMLLF